MRGKGIRPQLRWYWHGERTTRAIRGRELTGYCCSDTSGVTTGSVVVVGRSTAGGGIAAVDAPKVVWTKPHWSDAERPPTPD